MIAIPHSVAQWVLVLMLAESETRSRQYAETFLRPFSGEELDLYDFGRTH